MSTSEKQEPEPAAKSRERKPLGALELTSVLALSLCTAALGTTSTIRINSDDGFVDRMLKLLPNFGAAVLIVAVVLHAMLLRAVWTGRYPDERTTAGRRLACNTYCSSFTFADWRHFLGFQFSVVCSEIANHCLWWALRRACEAGEQTRPLRAASAAEKGDASTPESTDDKSRALTLPRLTVVCMLIFSSAGFLGLAAALYSGDIDVTLSVFGPCFLVALIIAALMLHGALSVPRILYGSNSQYLVSVYREGGLIVFPCTCMALGFAMWYYKGLPLNPGVYIAGHWATALYVGIAEVLEQSLSSH